MNLLTQIEIGDNNDEVKDKDEKPIELGMRLRIDQLTSIDTSKQEYSIKAMLDRDWLATENDIKNCEKYGKDYVPEQIAAVDFLNDVKSETKYDIDLQTGCIYKLVKNDFIDGCDGKYYNSQRIEFHGTFTEKFEVGSFPFDVQNLSFAFITSWLPSYRCKFVPIHTEDNSIFIDTSYAQISDWDIMNADIYTANQDEKWLNTHKNKRGNKEYIYPFVIFRLQVRRRWRSFFSRVIMWLFLLGLASFGILGYKPENIEGRLGYAITMILTLVAFQFVIQSELPKVAYLTFVDKYNITIFSFNLLLASESFIVGYHEEGIIEFANTKLFDQYFAIGAVIMFIFAHICFIIYASILYKKESNKLGQKPDLDLNRITDWDKPKDAFPSF